MTRETALALAKADVKPAAGLAPVDRRIFIIAAAAFALLMAFSARYGFDGDELYFLDCARHLSWSYVDQPVLVPLMARVSLDLFGVSVVGLRLWPALAAFATVIVCALLAREFGGGRKAQLTCAIGVATAPGLLVPDHILDTAPLDLLAWSALALLVVRMGRTGNARLWVPAGVIVGAGLNNKNLIGFFAIAIVIGTLLSGGAHFLMNRYFGGGALIAFAFAIPGIWWQAQHGWATIEMTKNLDAEIGGIHNGIAFVFWQLFMVAPVLILVWLSGLTSLWRSPRPLWRALAWSFGLLGLFFAATSGARPYFLAAAYFYLLAAGAVVLERRWAGTPFRTRALFGLAVPLYTLLNLVVIMPVLPARLSGWTVVVDTEGVQSIGWPQLTATVARVWHRLPADQRADAVIFTDNYGEAGAINELGASYHLPPAVSGHNNLWWWGPGNPGATTVVALVNDKAGSSKRVTAQLRGDFASVQAVATISNDVNPYENGGHVYLCTGPVRSWGSLWPSLRHYG